MKKRGFFKLQNEMIDMTRGSILRPIVRFAIPLIIGNLFQQLYNMVDSIVVGNFDSYTALSAVGTAWTPTQILMGLFLGVGASATILVAQAKGASNEEQIRQTVRTGNSFVLITSLPLTILGVIFSPYILRFMNVPPDVFDLAYQYIAVLFIGTLPNLGYNLNAGVLRGIGDSRAPLVCLALSSVVNIVLDVLFVIGFGWGVAGVGIATVIAQFTAWFYSIYHIRKHYPDLDYRPLSLATDRALLGKMLRLGLPIGSNNAVWAFGFLFLHALVNQQGSIFMAGATAAGRVDTLFFLPIMSFGAAATTFAGQNVGAGLHERVRKGMHVIVLLTLSVNQVLSILLLFFGEHVLRLFNQDPRVIEVGMNCILWFAPWYWLLVLYNLFNFYMNGGGEVRLPTVSTLVMFWAVRMPMAYFLADTLGPDFLYACYPISWTMGALISGLYYASGRWKKRHVL